MTASKLLSDFNQIHGLIGKEKMSLKSGHRIIPVISTEQEKQIKDFRGNGVGTIRLSPDNWFFTTPFIKFVDKIYDFKFKPSDVIVMTYPKCGTTWTQEIVWTMIHNPNLDNPAGDISVNVRAPFLEFDAISGQLYMPVMEPGNEIFEMFTNTHPERDPEDGIFLQLAELAPDPRVIKTHLPFSLLPPSLLDTCKVVYVVREPKDVAVSYHHHSRLISGHGFVGDMDSFINHFINDTLLYSPFWEHVKQGWANRKNPNHHFCFYEEIKENPKAAIYQLQDFLGTNLTDQQINMVVDHTSFSAMKARDRMIDYRHTNTAKHPIFNMEVAKSDGGFFRKGIAGDWKNKLTHDQAKKIDEWTREKAKNFGPGFKYLQ